MYSSTKMDVLNSKVAPSCKLVFETSNFSNTKSSHQRVIDSKFYNHQVISRKTRLLKILVDGMVIPSSMNCLTIHARV